MRPKDREQFVGAGALATTTYYFCKKFKFVTISKRLNNCLLNNKIKNRFVFKNKLKNFVLKIYIF